MTRFWGNHPGTQQTRGKGHVKTSAPTERLAAMERELANRREIYPDTHWMVREQIGRIAELFIFTSGGNWRSGDIKGTFGVCVSLSTLKTLEIGKTMYAIPKDAPTSRGYFVTLRELSGLCEIKTAETDDFSIITLQPFDYICDYGKPPIPAWINCLPCPLFHEGHCQSKKALEKSVSFPFG